jgi:hypothetical protein
MANFKLGTETYRTLDMDAEYDAHKSYTEKFKTFLEKSNEEIKDYTTEENKEHLFTVTYGLYGEMYNCFSPTYLMKLALTGQSSLFSSMLNRVNVPTGIGVYIFHNGKFHNLWTHKHYEPRQTPDFLNKNELKKLLKPYFSKLEIKLGLLKYDSTKTIAWQLETEKGIFFIPWHNGCVIENHERFSFEEKTFQEVKNIYCVLSFSSYEDGGYRIVTA